jgi:hypothetical protein
VNVHVLGVSLFLPVVAVGIGLAWFWFAVVVKTRLSPTTPCCCGLAVFVLVVSRSSNAGRHDVTLPLLYTWYLLPHVQRPIFD